MHLAWGDGRSQRSAPWRWIHARPFPGVFRCAHFRRADGEALERLSLRCDWTTGSPLDHRFAEDHRLFGVTETEWDGIF
jgi:hypothetical protein